MQIDTSHTICMRMCTAGEREEGMCERTVGKGSAGCAVMLDYDSIERRIVLLLQLMFSDRTKGA